MIQNIDNTRLENRLRVMENRKTQKRAETMFIVFHIH